jgi:DNA-directed RNA polymerase specialized sigma24 family protein
MSRYDIYTAIHKALRNFMVETLAALGRLDVEDAAEVSETLTGVRELLAVLRMHLEKENRFLHVPMHDREPGSADGTAEDHAGHERTIGRLESLAGEAQFRSGDLRRASVATLYRELAVFIAENFEHMNAEETGNNEVLWRTHSDDELQQIERAIVAELSPEMKAAVMRWMIPALPPAERAALLARMRSTMPAAAFDAILRIARHGLRERDWAKLSAALRLVPMAA